MTASVVWRGGNNKVLFSWVCAPSWNRPEVPSLPTTLHNAGDMSHLNYGPGEDVSWQLQCAEDVHITWKSFDIDTDVLTGKRKSDVIAFNLRPSFPYILGSTGYVTVTFRSGAVNVGEHGGFAFRYECVEYLRGSSGTVDRLLPNGPQTDTVWTVRCDGQFEVTVLERLLWRLHHQQRDWGVRVRWFSKGSENSESFRLSNCDDDCSSALGFKRQQVIR